MRFLLSSKFERWEEANSSERLGGRVHLQVALQVAELRRSVVSTVHFNGIKPQEKKVKHLRILYLRAECAA